MARAKNRFGLAGLQTHLNEVVYRRPWPIRLDRRLVPPTADRIPHPFAPGPVTDRGGCVLDVLEMSQPSRNAGEMIDLTGRSTDVMTEPASTTQTAGKERVFVGTGLFWGLIVGVVLAIGVVILAAQNTANITLAFTGWEFSTPLIVIVLGALLIGVVLDELFGLFYRARRRRTQRDRDQLQRLRQSQTLP